MQNNTSFDSPGKLSFSWIDNGFVNDKFKQIKVID